LGGSAGCLNLKIASGIDRGAHSLKYCLVAGKSDPTLACDQFISDPDGKLAAVTADNVDIDPQFFFE
jgi:hypothetical protein